MMFIDVLTTSVMNIRRCNDLLAEDVMIYEPQDSVVLSIIIGFVPF